MIKKDDISAPRLLSSAANYFKTASYLDESKAWQVYPQIHMYCLAIELGLKAFLRAKGISERDLINKYKHKLEKIFNDALDQGLRFEGSEIIREFISIYQDIYKNSGLRYIETGSVISIKKKSHTVLQDALKKMLIKIFPQSYRATGNYNARLLKHHRDNFKNSLEEIS